MTQKQKAFADQFIKCGDTTLAAISAGYPLNKALYFGEQNFNRSEIKDYIEQKLQCTLTAPVAGLQEVKEFWTGVLRDDNAEFKDRLKVSELLAKVNGGFIEKVQLDGNANVQIIDDIAGGNNEN